MRKVLPLLLLLACLLAAYVGLDFLQGPEEDGPKAQVPATESTPNAAHTLEPHRDPPDAPQQTVERTEVESEPLLSGTAPTDPPESSSIRLEITTVADRRGHPPADAAGWTARLCIYPDGWERFRWIDVPFDAEGIATLHYPYLRELRRAVAIPPEGSVQGAGYLIDRQLARAEEGQTFLITVGSAHQVHGEVATPEGRRLAGVPVQAFLAQEAPYLGYWQDSAFTTTTDTSGRFRFDRLGPGTWTFAVTPQDWLMVDPLHGRQKAPNGLLNLSPAGSDPQDLGTLTVIPARRIRVTLLDNGGAPVAAAGLQVHAEETARDDLQFTGWQNANVRKGNIGLPFEYRHRNTLKDGTADFCLPEGRWRLEIAGVPGIEATGTDMADFSFHTDDGDVTFRLYAQVGRLFGTVVDADGHPLESATLEMRWPVGDRMHTTGTYTDSLGRFEFPAVQRGRPFELRCNPTEESGLPSTWQATVHGAEEEMRIVSPATQPLHLQLDYPASQDFPVDDLYLRLEAWNPGPDADPSWREEWWERARHTLETFPSAEGRAGFPHLASGSYVVVLELRGKELHRWTLEAGDEVQRLQVSLPR